MRLPSEPDGTEQDGQDGTVSLRDASNYLRPQPGIVLIPQKVRGAAMSGAQFVEHILAQALQMCSVVALYGFDGRTELSRQLIRQNQ